FGKRKRTQLPNREALWTAEGIAVVITTGRPARQYSANLVGEATRLTPVSCRRSRPKSAALRNLFIPSIVVDSTFEELVGKSHSSARADSVSCVRTRSCAAG